VECDASVGTVVFSRLVLDSRGGFDGAAVSGMSLFVMLRGVHSVDTLHLITQVLVFRNINGESTIPSVLGMLLIVFCISCTDGWNMVSDTGYFHFLSLRAFSLDVPIPTLYVQVAPPVGPTNFHTRITRTYSYSHPHVRLSSYF